MFIFVNIEKMSIMLLNSTPPISPTKRGKLHLELYGVFVGGTANYFVHLFKKL